MATELMPQSNQRDFDLTVTILEPDKDVKPKPPPLETQVSVASENNAKTQSLPGSSRYERDKKIGHRRVDEAGQVTYKKKPTSELMAAMQLGIGQSITSLTTKPKRDLLLQDFSIVETVFFPREGSNLTPAHQYSDFRFKTYAPVAFRYFRELFGIQPDDFLLSLCNEALQELSNPGASGSIFYITNDDEFIIKTVQHKEAEFLQKLLPGYYMNLNQNPRTLLPKFYGLYCYQCGGKNIRFVVMNNLLPSSIKMHEKYDLKGSTYKRKCSKHERSKKTPTRKDLDFNDIHIEGIMLESETWSALIKTIERDCRVLQSFKIMDYSLLLGIHNLDTSIKERMEEREADVAAVEHHHHHHKEVDPEALNRSWSRGRSMKQRLAHFSTTMEAIQAQVEPVELENEDVPAGGIPARNQRGERLLLYIGVIDILQSFRLKKKLEHAMKSVVADGDTISVHKPGFYANRFQSYFSKTVFKRIPSSMKHSPSKRKAITGRQRSITEPADTSKFDKSMLTSIEEGAVGGRPDLLPDTSTPPPTFSEATQESDATSSKFSETPTSLRQGEVYHGHLGNGEPHHLGSPVHSYSESTPTHTDYTEGTPSFTTSSPSCSSDVLDSGASPRAFKKVTAVSHEQIEIEVSSSQTTVTTVTAAAASGASSSDIVKQAPPKARQQSESDSAHDNEVTRL